MRYRLKHSVPTIGVLAGWQFYRTATTLSYLVPVFRGLSRAAQDVGCNLLLGCGMGPSARPDDPLRPAWPTFSPDVDFVPISPMNVDGLIVANPLHFPARSQYIHNLIAEGFPVLFIGSGEAGPAIIADNTDSITGAMRHLVDHGHQHIAFIAGSADDMDGDTGERLRAYESFLAEHGLKNDLDRVAFGRHVIDGGYSAMQQIIKSGTEFTAVLASNDESAVGAMQALKEAGIRIPQDVAMIGFDNRPEGAVQYPALTSVHVPLYDMGYRALELIYHHIQDATPLTGTVKVNTRLVTRESCGCSFKKILVEERQSDLATLDDWEARYAQLSRTIAAMVFSHAHNLTEEECQFFSRNLVETFAASIKRHDQKEFHRILKEVLQRTASVEDDAHIWQDAISLLGKELGGVPVGGSSPSALVNDILDRARFTISAKMQRQHRQFVVDQRWMSSRLGLLTTRLLTALDEEQVYAILSQHLPVMNIRIALVVVFEAHGDEPPEWSVMRNALAPSEPPIRFRSYEFPPAGVFDKDGPYSLALIPLVDQSGQLGFVALGTDHLELFGPIVQQLGSALNTARLYRQATEGRRLAEEANRMKSHFLSTISHELRTPVNLVVGLSGIMLRNNDEDQSLLPELARKDVERIHAYAQHLGGLIGDVLDLATSDAGELRLNNEPVDLGQALRMAAESGRQLAADKGLDWMADLPENGPWVWGDRTRLRQVALNLINNAIKFTSQGIVNLKLEANADSVTVTVQDTGLGIPLEEQQQVFDEFHQSERSIKRGYTGLGLGLAICKRLVEMHKGTIGVHSTGEEGAGSTFYFTLPTIRPPEEQPTLSTLLPAPEQNPEKADESNVLVLSNYPEAVGRLKEHLVKRGLGVHVSQLDSLADWKTHVRAATPDAIILDMSTASNATWDTLKALKSNQLTRRVPVLFYASSQGGESVLELDYLTKPIEMTELIQALDQHWLVSNSNRPTRTFLVVDDEPNTLEMQARIIQGHSSANHVLKACNGHEALAILRREKIDLVLLDLQMPEMDGFALLDEMRAQEQLRDIPVIVVTGKTLTEADMARLNRGVSVVLEKGLFSIDETLAHIAAALERKRRLSGEAQRLVRIAMAYFHEHFASTITRQDVAQYVGITEDYLTFCFRQELGTTPVEYLQRYRVNQAKRLLKESNQSITEIALQVGFSDSGYFSRIFRREVGIAPEAFRRSS